MMEMEHSDFKISKLPSASENANPKRFPACDLFPGATSYKRQLITCTTRANHVCNSC